MAKKVVRNKRRAILANEIREGFDEMMRWAKGEKAVVIVHHVVPNEANARRSAQILGIVKREPKAVRRALKDQKAS